MTGSTLIPLLILGAVFCGCWAGGPRSGRYSRPGRPGGSGGYGGYGGPGTFNEVFGWNIIDYEFPSEQARQAAISTGAFVPGNSVPMGLEVWREKLFISVPRLGSGVPSALNYIRLDGKEKSPKLIPYPSWEAQDLSPSNPGVKIVSPFRMNVDQCDRLWTVDLGITDIKTSFTKLFQPRILVFDLNTDQLVVERAIEVKLLPCKTWIANIIIDVDKNDCGNAWAYISDLWGKVLIVYNLKTNSAFQVQHPFFNSDALAVNYFIGGFNFRWDDGIFGLALSPRNPSGDKTLYFHSLSAYTEFAVSTNSLQNETAAAEYYNYRLLGGRGELGQAGAQSMDAASGIIFFTSPHKNGIGCWNSRRNPEEYTPKTAVTIYTNNETLIYPSDLKVDRLGRVWVVSNKLPVFNNDALDNSIVNFRIVTGEAAKVVENTPCDPHYSEPLVFDNQFIPKPAVIDNQYRPQPQIIDNQYQQPQIIDNNQYQHGHHHEQIHPSNHHSNGHPHVKALSGSYVSFWG